jgi:hypothetical protein
VIITDYIPHGLITAVAGVVAWAGKTHLAFDKKTRERVEALEVNHVTKADIDGIRTRLDGLGTEMATAQREILTAILTSKSV